MSKIMEKATETSGFLDGRDYTAAFLHEFFSLIVGNGVYANELAPTATNENMTITHGTGHAWINGVCYKNKTPFVLGIATADGALNRYDSLMLRLNLSQNEVYATIVQGDYATNPTPPAVTRNADIFDLKICDIYIPAGCTKITQDLITDTRLDDSVCGVPVFPVEHLDMTTFYRQVATDLDNLKKKEQAEILELLQQLNDLVEGDTVGKLVAKINKKLTSAVILLPASGWNGGEQTIAIVGVTADASKSDVFASPAPADNNLVEYAKCNVRLYAQLDGAVKFKCDTVPEIDLAVNVMVKV